MMKKKRISRFLQMKRKIMVIMALLYGAVFIFMFLLELFSAKKVMRNWFPWKSWLQKPD